MDFLYNAECLELSFFSIFFFNIDKSQLFKGHERLQKSDYFSFNAI